MPRSCGAVVPDTAAAAPGMLTTMPLESAATLLSCVRASDTAARERLCGQYLPILRRWAHGRLLPAARWPKRRV